MNPERHRLIVDSIEEDVAAVEADGERVLRVPVWLLPPGTKEGDELVVRRCPVSGGTGVVIELRLRDEEVSSRERAAPARDAADPGGDIVL